uniref:Uncharacterized protein n=1 Tax=Arundo donax TaxID=35708 RepID=A0A0A9CFY3_ARUDO
MSKTPLSCDWRGCYTCTYLLGKLLDQILHLEEIMIHALLTTEAAVIDVFSTFQLLNECINPNLTCWM